MTSGETGGWRVEELARRGDVSVDTVRFYQKRRLLPPPRREGRIAWYGPSHLTRLGRIRELQGEGFPLAVIGRILDGEIDAADVPLAAAVAQAEDTASGDEPLSAAALSERGAYRLPSWRRSCARASWSPDCRRDSRPSPPPTWTSCAQGYAFWRRVFRYRSSSRWLAATTSRCTVSPRKR
ncbi:MAG: MerR family transcriptional regulator [Acidimicrobiia bacterium]|nr:MerR family transcriptional regulator [Acidimicrobiia bacterium]